MEDKKNNISRRGFLKVMGAGATVAAGAAMESCTPKKTQPMTQQATTLPQCPQVR